MASPIFKAAGKRIKTRKPAKKTYKPPKPHQCENMYFMMRERLGSNVNPVAVHWDCNLGWFVGQRYVQPYSMSVVYKPYSIAGVNHNNLKSCPFCQVALPTVNEVSIT